MCDDYGRHVWRKSAMDEFIADKPEKTVIKSDDWQGSSSLNDRRKKYYADSNQNALWDDPRDYGSAISYPDQFLWDEASLVRIDFDGYMLTVGCLLLEKPAHVLDAT